MALHWVTGFIDTTQASTGLVSTPQLIYNNGRTVSGNITLIQKVVVVAHHLMAITSTVDLFRFRLVVAEEGITPTVADPEDQDERIKGLYPFANGPVYFSPRRKIAVPSEHSLDLLIEKVSGVASSDVVAHWRFLLYTSLE